MPARMKQPLSNASGRSVEVRIHTAGNGCPTLVKKLLSSGRVPLSLHHGEGVHLQAVVVVEAQRLMLDHPLVQLETGLLQTLFAAGMAAVQHGHIVLLRHFIDGGEKAHEILLRVDVLLPVGGKQNVLALFQSQAGVDVAGFDFGQVVVEHFGHGAAGDVGALLGQAVLRQVTAGVLRVAQVHVGDDVHDAAVGLLGQALVLAAVARLHVEDGDVQPLGPDDAEAGVGVTQHQDGVGLQFHHQVVAFGDDVPHGLAQGRLPPRPDRCPGRPVPSRGRTHR